jgi:hypothetical protein
MARRSTLLLATTVLGVLMFSGVALAAAITGTVGPDVLHGDPFEADTIYAYGGNDGIWAADGNADAIYCGGGVDSAYVDQGQDTTVRCEDVRPGGVGPSGYNFEARDEFCERFVHPDLQLGCVA